MRKHNPGPIAPPTLMGPIPTHTTPSMLSSLDKKASGSRKKKRGRSPIWFTGLALLLTGLVVGGGVMIANNVTASIKPASIPVSNIIATPSTKSATFLVKADTTLEEAPTSQAATIVNDLPIQEPKAQTHAKSSNDPHDRLSAALEGSPLIPSSTTKHSGGKTTATKTKTSKTAKKDKSHHAHKTKFNHHHPNDSDVTLLAALVASTNQDVVERKPGDSTASLLKRCEKLGSLEGALCSKRICSGQWKSEPGCVAIEKNKQTSAENKDK